MKRFTYDQTVTVANPDHPLVGKSGVVKRIRISDDGAWVAMNDGLPDNLRSFSEDDEYGRGSHIILYPEDCQ